MEQNRAAGEDSLAQVRHVLVDVIGSDRMRGVRDDDLLFEHRVVDSLHLVEFVERIESTFGLELDPVDINPTNFSSMRTIAEFVDGAKRS